jgi:hypothetical protein
MSVDLDRLREALGNEPEVAISAIYLGHKAGEEDHQLVLDTAQAVLDAPRVWWCVGERHVFDEAQDDGPCARWHMNLACGWVVLVPVEGGEE